MITSFPLTLTHFINAHHRNQVIALWRAVFGYETAHNDPALVIDRKMAVDDGLFFVAIAGDAPVSNTVGTPICPVVGTIMAGYDGHRGWIYSVAVSPEHRKRGIGSRLVAHAEAALIARGCVKINLQIMEGNESVAGFYAAMGYAVEKRVSMGKRIGGNVPG